jgi:hypothetical protein
LATYGQISAKLIHVITIFRIFRYERSKNAENLCKCKIVDMLGNFERIISHQSVPLFEHMTNEKYMSSCELLLLIWSSQHFTFHSRWTSHLIYWNDNLLYNGSRPNAWSIDRAVNTIMTCASVTVSTLPLLLCDSGKMAYYVTDTLRREHRVGRSRCCQIFTFFERHCPNTNTVPHKHTFSAFLRLANIFTGPPLKQL